jgi:hypothetical protein
MAKRRTTGFAPLACLTLAPLATACNLFSPDVGPRARACSPVGAAAASTPSNSAYGPYGPAASSVDATTPADATTPIDAAPCGDAASNTVAPDAAVAGNVVIADQLNNRVIEVARDGTLVWHFGDGSWRPSSTSVVGPNDVERLPADGGTLIAATGAPPGSEHGCDAGCSDNRVLIVSSGGDVVWCYGATIDGGAVDGGLSGPAAARHLVTDGGAEHVLIVDQGNQRVIEVDRATQAIVWQFPPVVDASAVQRLSAPNSAERLPNGDTLIADQGANRVFVVNPAGTIVWQYDTELNAPGFASSLKPADGGTIGNTLITDSNNHRILEVSIGGSVAWSYTLPGGSVPTHAVRLANGHTLIAAMSTDQILEIDNTPANNVVYSHGELGSAGSTGNLLDQPYDAKLVGDYTGLTSPGPTDSGH